VDCVIANAVKQSRKGGFNIAMDCRACPSKPWRRMDQVPGRQLTGSSSLRGGQSPTRQSTILRYRISLDGHAALAMTGERYPARTCLPYLALRRKPHTVVPRLDPSKCVIPDPTASFPIQLCHSRGGGNPQTLQQH